MQNSRTPTSRPGVAVLVLALLIVAALTPASLVRIPAMADYPNHLARMYLIRSGGNPYYRVEWALYPNLAMDLVVPQLGRLVGIANATRAFLLVAQILVLGGALAVEYAVKRRLQLAGFAGVMFLYCLPFTWGFINFEMAFALALWGIAAMLALEEQPWWWRLAVNTVGVVVLVVAHFFALGIYGAVLGWHELWRAWRRGASLQETTLRLVLLAVPAAAVLTAMFLSGGALGKAVSPWRWYFILKPLWLFSIMNGYVLTVSWLTVSLLVGWLVLATKRGVVRFAPAGLWMAVGFALLYLAVPAQLFGASFVDMRVIVAAVFIMPAFLTLDLPNRRWLMASLACASLLTFANLAVVYTVWLSYQAPYAAMIRSFHMIEKGSLVLVADAADAEDPPMHHLTEFPMFHAATLAAHYADAFVPDLFAAVGQQPLRPRAAVARLARAAPGPMPIAALVAIAEGRPPASTPDFVRNWQRDFDYLYVLDPHCGNPLPALLQQVTRNRHFALYRIRRP